MGNYLGTGKPKTTFEWDSVSKTFEPDHNRVQFYPKFNIEDKRVHKSELNGYTIKEHLGFYHEAEIYYHSITAVEYEDVLRYIEKVDSVTLTPFEDNPDFEIEMLIEKAKVFEMAPGSGLSGFYCKMKSTGYGEVTPKPTFEASTIWLITEEEPLSIAGWASFEEEFLIPAPQGSGWASFEEEFLIPAPQGSGWASFEESI